MHGFLAPERGAKKEAFFAHIFLNMLDLLVFAPFQHKNRLYGEGAIGSIATIGHDRQARVPESKTAETSCVPAVFDHLN
ncbi:hypothetical protein [Shimia thalassica]|uniref:hypothetical protein n=1 Tax=Shimia thalassica TaxID=1715693 RepID=UPI0011A1ED3C|nr:hypothetical protein [Shimia thalassica]